MGSHARPRGVGRSSADARRQQSNREPLHGETRVPGTPRAPGRGTNMAAKRHRRLGARQSPATKWTAPRQAPVSVRRTRSCKRNRVPRTRRPAGLERTLTAGAYSCPRPLATHEEHGGASSCRSRRREPDTGAVVRSDGDDAVRELPVGTARARRAGLQRPTRSVKGRRRR